MRSLWPSPAMAASFIAIGLVAGGILPAGGCGSGYDGPMTIVPPEQADMPPGVLPVTFTLLSRPSIEVTHGHAHDPVFGFWGSNIYAYSGKLEFDGKKARLTSGLHPVAMFKTDGEYYLLEQSWFNHESFQWRRLASDLFEETGLKAVPPALLGVHPVDQVTSSLFRLWVVGELLASDGPDAAAERFSAYVKEDARFAYGQNPNWRPNRFTTLPDLLNKVREKKAVGFYEPLLAVLKSSTPADDAQDVGLVGLTVKDLRPDEGAKEVQDFIQNVTAEGGPDDPRLSDLLWRLK
jgi:hypothetical protein